MVLRRTSERLTASLRDVAGRMLVGGAAWRTLEVHRNLGRGPSRWDTGAWWPRQIRWPRRPG